ncbi:hypothetical protein GLAREA_12758 [Glarea lozoyensis ATCC 20868]|uniref:Uncharacterized protein n=1 Tax=Glarea lozoyensis (strain ATCC 20868 / MF5171) TaxID=1116229 RepID=S3D0S6_GLAL2|nr:uncharacterized protein GLAREA_12758 [Glarea lozoyensis ATCC 20868]EPE31455.1 hypothetical protein GLAREA_12758 [Glarea lozoyensis ATCC 20868]
MKSNSPNLLVLLSFLTSLEAQFIPEADARLLAWRAYGTFVQQQLTAGVPLSPGKDFIYVTPPNLAAVRGGTPCPDSVTNFDLFSLADGLQNVNEPLLDNAGASYVDSLYTYLQSVNLGTAPPTTAQLTQIQTLTDALAVAQDKFDTQSNIAYGKYLADVRAQALHQSFGAWVTAKDPLYTSLQRQRNTANTALQNYEASVYGAQFSTLSSQRDKIVNNAGEELSSVPGYNMGVYGAAGTYNVKISPFQANQITDGLIYKPAYSLSGGFEEVCDAWINYTGPVNTVYNWNMNNVNGKDWSSLGHTTSVSNTCHLPSILPDPPMLSHKPTLADGVPFTRVTLLTRLHEDPVATRFQPVATPVSVAVETGGALLAEATLKPRPVGSDLLSHVHPRQVLLPSPTRVTEPTKICQRQTQSENPDNVELGTDYVRVVGASVFWGLISANKGSTTDTTVFNQWTERFSTSVSLKLTMKGLQVFNVGAGFWDVGGVRTTYPNLLPPPLGKNTLAGKVRLQRLLIGTEVGLTITVSDTGTYNSIYSFIQDAKTSVGAGGGFSIFGIRFGAGGGKTTTTHREVKDVSFVTLQEGGQVIIAPSPKGVPVQLGALGKAL